MIRDFLQLLRTRDERPRLFFFAAAGVLAVAIGFVLVPARTGRTLIMQWGYATGASNTISVSFPISFPTSVFSVTCNTANRTTSGSNGWNYVSGVSTSGFTMLVETNSTGGYTGYWMAVGY